VGGKKMIFYLMPPRNPPVIFFGEGDFSLNHGKIAKEKLKHRTAMLIDNDRGGYWWI